MRILVVEDEPILLRQLTRRVQEALPEAEIVAFDNADDALAALPSGVINIAFLDIASTPQKPSNWEPATIL